MAMNLRLPDTLNERVRSQAEAERVSMQALVTKAVEQYLTRNHKREMLDAGLAQLNVDFADALRRLGE